MSKYRVQLTLADYLQSIGYRKEKHKDKGLVWHKGKITIHTIGNRLAEVSSNATFIGFWQHIHHFRAKASAHKFHSGQVSRLASDRVWIP